jgi:hypothetical protein
MAGVLELDVAALRATTTSYSFCFVQGLFHLFLGVLIDNQIIHLKPAFPRFDKKLFDVYEARFVGSLQRVINEVHTKPGGGNATTTWSVSNFATFQSIQL